MKVGAVTAHFCAGGDVRWGVIGGGRFGLTRAAGFRVSCSLEVCVSCGSDRWRLAVARDVRTRPY